MAELRLAPAAERDLESIWQYTLQEWGPDQAFVYRHFGGGLPGTGRSSEFSAIL
jgi:hypothetical protein